MSHADTPAGARKLIYALLIVVAAASAAGRIASAEFLLEPTLYKKDANNPEEKGRKWPGVRPLPMPTFSSNDRSRWATVRALVDEGKFEVGRRQPANNAKGYVDSGVIFEDGWQSLDKVLNPELRHDSQGNEYCSYYSSKPPLLSVLAAGLYWLLQSLCGWTLAANPFSVVRISLVVLNLLPFVVYLVLLAVLLEGHGRTEWGRIFVLAAACFATLLTPFLITFNNHTVAACSVLFALFPVFPLLRVPWQRAEQSAELPWWAFAVSGLFAGFAACNELPALAFTAALGGFLLVQAPRQTLLIFLPALLVPLAAQYWLNYLALGELNFAYSKFGTEWYEYKDSYWTKPKAGEVKHGIDWAWMHESRAAYAFHVLLGHHGMFSLTPIVIFAAVGMGWALGRLRRSDPSRERPGANLVAVGTMTLILTVVVVGFYLFNNEANHNYGGWTNGPRWLMWLTPLWLLTMLPVVDWLGQRRWGRWLAYAFLAVSVFSMHYFAWNPWRHPWLFNWLESGGYVVY